MKIFLANQNQVRANFKLKEFIENLTEHQRARAVRYKDLGAAFNFAIGRKLLFEGLKVLGPVSYTHLTLPTIYSV